MVSGSFFWYNLQELPLESTLSAVKDQRVQVIWLYELIELHFHSKHSKWLCNQLVSFILIKILDYCIQTQWKNIRSWSIDFTDWPIQIKLIKMNSLNAEFNLPMFTTRSVLWLKPPKKLPWVWTSFRVYCVFCNAAWVCQWNDSMLK